MLIMNDRSDWRKIGKAAAAGIGSLLFGGYGGIFSPRAIFVIEVAWFLALWYVYSDIVKALLVTLFATLIAGVIGGLGNAFTGFFKAGRFGEYRSIVGSLVGFAAFVIFIVIIAD